MLVFFFDNSNKSELFSDLSVYFSVHVEELMRLFAISEGFFELLFNFTAYRFKLLSFI